MNGANNRDIHAGDKVEIVILRRDGRITKENGHLEIIKFKKIYLFKRNNIFLNI